VGFEIQGSGVRVQGSGFQGSGVEGIRTTVSQKCEAVPRRARI